MVDRTSAQQEGLATFSRMIDPEEHQEQVLEMFKHKNECDEIDLEPITPARRSNYSTRAELPAQRKRTLWANRIY